jgi:cell division protein FtsZ
MQHKNLKMREAFGKADDVLSTAAKCITDIINSNGQINVDFADVCTVMRKGGVAILGSAVAEGDARAQTAIEDAINSPLLNDSDISGAKWILLNINTSEGEFECGTDEFELINDFVREKAGDETDVIVGMGIDETLGKGLSVTLIATGFEHKNPFDKDATKKVADKDKVLFTLDMQEKPQPVAKPIAAVPAAEPQVTAQAAGQPQTAAQPAAAAVQQTESESLTPRLVENQEPLQAVAPTTQHKQPEPVSEQAPEVVHFTLDAEPQQQTAVTQPAQPSENKASVDTPTPTPQVHVQEQQSTQAPELEFGYSEKETTATNDQQEATQVPGFLNKPANIYAPQPAKPQHAFVQHPKPVEQPQASAQQPVPQRPAASQPQQQPVQQRPAMNTIPNLQQEEEEMQIVYKEAPQPVTNPAQPVGVALGGDQDLSEEEMKKRKAEERIQKLRNLSYNVQSGDPNGDFDAVPAYVRRNLEMLGGAESSTAENYYSKYTVNKDEKEGTNISSLNAFLEGKKPD